MEYNVRYNVKKQKGLSCKDKSLTVQSMAKDADINNIMKKFEKTGVLPNMIKENPQYGDFSQVPDLLEAHMIIEKAETQFMALPASVRKEFDNDPAEFLGFVHDPKNHDKLVKMGLAERKPAPAAPKAKPAEPGNKVSEKPLETKSEG